MDDSSCHNSEYEVQSIIDEMENNGVMLYKVHWKGYSVEDATWEPFVSLLNCLDAVEEYKNKNKNKRNYKAKKISKYESFISIGSKNKKERLMVKKHNIAEIKSVYSIKRYSKDNKELIDLFKNHKLIKIISAKKEISKDISANNEFFLSCELSNSNIKPFISNLLLRNFYPMDLIDFYESKINFS